MNIWKKPMGMVKRKGSDWDSKGKAQGRGSQFCVGDERVTKALDCHLGRWSGRGHCALAETGTTGSGLGTKEILV
jgi:hypothetical protein